MTAAPRGFTCASDDGYPVTVLRPRGLLSFATVATVRSATLTVLANRPDLLMFDLSELAVGDDITLTAFSALHRQAAEVDVALMLAGPTSTLLSALGSMAVVSSVPVYRSLCEALEAFDRLSLPDRSSRLVLPGPAAGVEVRELVDCCCERWGLGYLADTAALIATELAANAVRHARTAFRFTVSRRRHHLHLTALDHSPDLPRRGAEVDADGPGRGLLIIEAVSHAWGFVSTAEGKVVWATLRLRRAV
jgi:anti-anti-sigma regulatory factor